MYVGTTYFGNALCPCALPNYTNKFLGIWEKYRSWEALPQFQVPETEGGNWRWQGARVWRHWEKPEENEEWLHPPIFSPWRSGKPFLVLSTISWLKKTFIIIKKLWSRWQISVGRFSGGWEKCPGFQVGSHPEEYPPVITRSHTWAENQASS